MRGLTTMLYTLIVVAVAGAIAWIFGLGGLLHGGHALDWFMGVFCLFWLVVVLTVPWNLYFEAQTVAFELQRSRERLIAIPPGREEYVRLVQRRLLWLALATHALSAVLIAGVTCLTRGGVGYYFAGFYILSMAFRPAAAGYAFLSAKLRTMARETHYPREDVVKLCADVELHRVEIEQLREELKRETTTRSSETRQLRENTLSLSREFETAISRLTDNQQVIQGVQAFVKLVVQSMSHVSRSNPEL